MNKSLTQAAHLTHFLTNVKEKLAKNSNSLKISQIFPD